MWQPKALAEHLHYLASHEDEYESACARVCDARRYESYLSYRLPDSPRAAAFKSRLHSRGYAGNMYNDPSLVISCCSAITSADLPHSSHFFECELCRWVHERRDGTSKTADPSHLSCPVPHLSFPLRARTASDNRY